jgi:hypothetical protein
MTINGVAATRAVLLNIANWTRYQYALWYANIPDGETATITETFNLVPGDNAGDQHLGVWSVHGMLNPRLLDFGSVNASGSTPSFLTLDTEKGGVIIGNSFINSSGAINLLPLRVHASFGAEVNFCSAQTDDPTTTVGTPFGIGGGAGYAFGSFYDAEPTIEFVFGSNGSANVTSNTYSNVPLGEPGDRMVVVCQFNGGNPIAEPLSVTIGGISATRAIYELDFLWDANSVGIWYAKVPNGTDVSITETFATNRVNSGIGVYVLRNLREGRLYDVNSFPIPYNSTSIPISIEVERGGFAIFITDYYNYDFRITPTTDISGANFDAQIFENDVFASTGAMQTGTINYLQTLPPTYIIASGAIAAASFI